MEDLGNLMEYSSNIKLANEISSYKPLRHPISTPPQPNETSEQRYARKMLVRDWFFFAVWASRIKKIFAKIPKILENKEKRLEEYKKSSNFLSEITLPQKRNIEYNGGRLETERSGESDEEKAQKERQLYINQIRKRITDELAKSIEEKKKSDLFYCGVTIIGRCQEINSVIFTESRSKSINFQVSVIFLSIIESRTRNKNEPKSIRPYFNNI